MIKRLPQNYIPINYYLYLHIVYDKYPFDAIVKIIFRKNKDDDQIFLNIDSNIVIKKITQNSINLNYEVHYPQLIIERSKSPYMDFDSYPITIEYTVSPSKDYEEGFFMLDKNYFTKFEPNGACKLLPCFDEPSIRSTFSVKLLIPSKLTALSNMPIETIEEKENDNEIEITFQKTPPMCTYLLCLCIGTFSSIVGSTKSGTPVKFYTKCGNENLLKKSLDTAIYSLNWLETKFGVKFELPSLQLISHELYPGGMENYGLITLTDITDSINSLFNNLIIMHEIVHQWFGDLVCIKYWDSLWLNEGFAEFIQYLIMKDYRPHYDFFTLFAQNEASRCFQFFDDNNVISPSCEDDVDIDNLFNTIMYAKGSFVVKMFYDLIGEPLFVKVCSEYLNEFKNKCAEVNDFISIASSILEKNMNVFFDPWLRFPGFPFLIVEEIECGSQKVGITIKQKSKNECVYQFNVPILYEKDDVIGKKVVEIRSSCVNVDLEFDWLIVNDELASLCFVIYSKKLLNALKKPNVEKKISSLNKTLIRQSVESNSVSNYLDDETIELIKMNF